MTVTALRFVLGLLLLVNVGGFGAHVYMARLEDHAGLAFWFAVLGGLTTSGILILVVDAWRSDRHSAQRSKDLQLVASLPTPVKDPLLYRGRRWADPAHKGFKGGAA